MTNAFHNPTSIACSGRLSMKYLTKTIRTINGVFARVVDGMTLMRRRPPTSTARIARTHGADHRAAECTCQTSAWDGSRWADLSRAPRSCARAALLRAALGHGCGQGAVTSSVSHHASDRPTGSGGG